MADVRWIWFDEGATHSRGCSAARAPAGPRYFRKAFDYRPIVDAPPDEATLEITAAGRFTASPRLASVTRAPSSASCREWLERRC